MQIGLVANGPDRDLLIFKRLKSEQESSVRIGSPPRGGEGCERVTLVLFHFLGQIAKLLGLFVTCLHLQLGELSGFFARQQ